MPKKDTELKSVKTGEQTWKYPDLGLSITAESQEAADARAEEIKAARA
jgi:hypothetical protein